jgi:hypothetical protein
MNYRTVTLPKVVHLNIPSDYARAHPSGPITVTEQIWGDGLRVEWDDSRITFSAGNGSVTFRRSAIIGYLVEERPVMSWRFCQLNAELEDGLRPVLYGPATEKRQFDEVLRSLVDAGVPIGGGLGGAGKAKVGP